MRASPTRPSSRRPPAGSSNISRTVGPAQLHRLDRGGEPEADMDDIAAGRQHEGRRRRLVLLEQRKLPLVVGLVGIDAPVRPPLIGGASLPKRAESASATCPAGTIGMAARRRGRRHGERRRRRRRSTLPGVKTLPRVAGSGAVRPPARRRRERGRSAPKPPCGIMSANASAACQPRFRCLMRLMPPAFSAEIAANSSRRLGVG